jgi:hypothetical protein
MNWFNCLNYKSIDVFKYVVRGSISDSYIWRQLGWEGGVWFLILVHLYVENSVTMVSSLTAVETSYQYHGNKKNNLESLLTLFSQILSPNFLSIS